MRPSWTEILDISGKSVHLQCVFHSIRFKVNKGWSKALLLFLCLYLTEILQSVVEITIFSVVLQKLR